MLLVFSEYSSVMIETGGACLPLSFVMVNVGLLNRYTRLGGSGEIGGKMKSLVPRSMTLGHMEVAEMYLDHLYL
jgi:hypothetical protein